MHVDLQWHGSSSPLIRASAPTSLIPDSWPLLQVIDRYVAMRDALNATGRPLLYSLCEWGVADPWKWAPKVGWQGVG